MKRKVVNISGNTMMVTLPAKWVSLNNIKKGQEIDVEEDNDILIMRSKAEEKLSTVELSLDLTKVGDIRDCKHILTYRIIGNLYKRGVDILKIRFEDPDVFKFIRKICSNLIGFEIIEQEKNFCLIKNIAVSLDEDFENIKRRAMRLTIEMASQIVNEIKCNNYNLKNEFEQMMDTVGRYNDLTKRLISRSKETSNSKPFRYIILWEFEKLSHYYVYIYDEFVKYKKPLSKELMDLLVKVFELTKGYYESYFKKDIHYMIDIANKKNELYWKDAHNLFDKTISSESRIVHYLSVIIRKVYDIQGMYFALNY